MSELNEMLVQIIIRYALTYMKCKVLFASYFFYTFIALIFIIESLQDYQTKTNCYS